MAVEWHDQRPKHRKLGMISYCIGTVCTQVGIGLGSGNAPSAPYQISTRSGICAAQVDKAKQLWYGGSLQRGRRLFAAGIETGKGAQKRERSAKRSRKGE
eukprot:scaffold3118_cov264-Pinguiococcus_pyrenoidosus.AAC.3